MNAKRRLNQVRAVPSVGWGPRDKTRSGSRDGDRQRRLMARKRWGQRSRWLEVRLISSDAVESLPRSERGHSTRRRRTVLMVNAR